MKAYITVEKKKVEEEKIDVEALLIEIKEKSEIA